MTDAYESLSLNLPHRFFLEPFGKNTAAPIGLAALYTLAQGAADEPLLVLPSDHAMNDTVHFNAAIQTALNALDDQIIIFGIKPH
ncbi:sugar phosphate nucleotidyltransferase, partial [Acinetobacter baumannii]